MRKRDICFIVLIFIAILIICLFIYTKNNEVVNNDTGSKNTVENIDNTVNLDNSDEKIDWESLDSSTLELNDKSVTITKEGTYTLNGTITNGSIIVDTDGDVKLILDNVTINSQIAPCIIVLSANNIVIELKENTINTLESGSSYLNEEYDGVIYSKDDLIFQGTGTLKVTSNYKDAIVSKDDLKIVSGSYVINSKDDGIRGKDSVYILAGNFDITAVGDGIKATNDTDSSKGFINIDGGIFNIISSNDGIQAETKLIINGGTFNIKSGGGATTTGSARNRMFGGNPFYDDESTKGLKAGDNLIITGGIFDINSKDDAIHSNNYVGIKNAVIEISTGDDGIHADKELVIDNGTITINSSYEGLEANNITINNGTIKLTASDDGINISGGADSSSINRPGANFNSVSGGVLTINGGEITVTSSGDGLDSNGNIIMNGGVVYVNGPTDNGNGALDYNGTFIINGGNLVAVGSSGMAQSTSSTSKNYSLMFNLTNNYNGKITLTDSKNNTILEFNPTKSYQNVVISSEEITKGETYNLKINGEIVSSLTATSVSTSNGNQMNGKGKTNGNFNGRR